MQHITVNEQERRALHLWLICSAGAITLIMGILIYKYREQQLLIQALQLQQSTPSGEPDKKQAQLTQAHQQYLKFLNALDTVTQLIPCTTRLLSCTYVHDKGMTLECEIKKREEFYRFLENLKESSTVMLRSMKGSHTPSHAEVVITFN